MLPKVKKLEKENNNLKIITEGCFKHKSYRAKRKPIANCEICNKMWDARQTLNY
jgi:hypothetical protein